MEFKYYTKITKDNIDEIWDNLIANVPKELNKKFYINYSRLRAEPEYPLEFYYPMKTHDDFINHIKKADPSIIFSNEFEEEFRLFENDYMIMYNENSPDFNIGKIKEKLLTNNLYFENDLAIKERREYISNIKV